MTRSAIGARSNSAIAPRMRICGLPAGVVAVFAGGGFMFGLPRNAQMTLYGMVKLRAGYLG